MNTITLDNGLQFIVEDEEQTITEPLATVININDYSYIVVENQEQ